jgi:hypothetical protein
MGSKLHRIVGVVVEEGLATALEDRVQLQSRCSALKRSGGSSVDQVRGPVRSVPGAQDAGQPTKNPRTTSPTGALRVPVRRRGSREQGRPRERGRSRWRLKPPLSIPRVAAAGERRALALSYLCIRTMRYLVPFDCIFGRRPLIRSAKWCGVWISFSALPYGACCSGRGSSTDSASQSPSTTPRAMRIPSPAVGQDGPVRAMARRPRSSLARAGSNLLAGRGSPSAG